MNKLKYLTGSIILVMLLSLASPSFNVSARPLAAPTQVDLGTAQSFAVLAGSGITNTGPTTITGDVGTFPTTTETGFASVTLTGASTNHAGDAVTQGAKTDLTAAYVDAAGQGPTTPITADLGTMSPLKPGVYNSGSSIGLTGTLILDGQNNPDAVFIFQAGSSLTTASSSKVVLINGAQACNIYWQVGSSATLGTTTAFQGTILALTSITMTTKATLIGRALARNGAVTLDTNTITRPLCSPAVTTTLSSNPITAGGTVHDSASLVGDTANSGGTVTYSVYSNNTCTGAALMSGGVKNVTNGVALDSDSLTFPVAGTYYWQVVYSGDANNNAATSACVSEALIVNSGANVTPTLTTNLSATSVTVGSSVNDTATLTGAAPSAGGTVTYTYYTDSACTLNAVDAGTKTVTGVGNNVPNSNSMPFNLAGTYYWRAIYSGGTGTNGAISTCNVASEILTVDKATLTLTTTASGPVTIGGNITDTAHLVGGYGTLIGTLTFYVYAPGDTTCVTSSVVGTPVTVNGAGDYTSASYTTTTAGIYRWRVYYSGDANNDAVFTACNDPGETSTVTTGPTPIPTPGSPGGVPGTGFAPRQVTVLSAQPAQKAYVDLGDLWLEIPRLGVQIPIVGVPQTDGEWDVSWLEDQAGWLNGSAFPTWKGNSVLTGHVYDSSGNPGPFVHLNWLWWGDKVIVHAWGGQYVYEVRSVNQVSPLNTAAMMKHEESPWVTLVTCLGYDEASNSYKYRILVRAVLVEVN